MLVLPALSGAHGLLRRKEVIPLDLKELKQLRQLKREIMRIDKAIHKLQSKDVPIVAGKVRGSSKDFPYTEVRTSVLMYEPKANDALNKLICLKEDRRQKAQEQVIEIEEFISGISDSETRQIFEMYFQEGMKQSEIAEKMGIERSTVSKRITGYINFHTHHIFM